MENLDISYNSPGFVITVKLCDQQSSFSSTLNIVLSNNSDNQLSLIYSYSSKLAAIFVLYKY